MKNKPLVSIIIRTKNEQNWIDSCLKSIFNQSYKKFEIILVDNNSTDNTTKIAKKFNIKITKLKNFKPGRAINYGIKKSKGSVIVCLSGHCIPVDKDWLINLIKNLNTKNVAGVYGRQEPLSFSSDLNKRDLFYTFGLDKKIQKFDTFFHNANSAFLRKTWKKFPFDENVSNIEDRVWGEKIINSGLKIIYEPRASVFHYHGIHHDQNPQRAKNVVKILESLKTTSTNKKPNKKEKIKILTVIPIKGKTIFFNNTSLLELTVKSALENNFNNDIVILTDNKETAKLCKNFKNVIPIIRPVFLSNKFISDQELINFTIKELSKKNKSYDMIVSMKETYPFRPSNLINKMISKMISKGYDTIFAGKVEKRNIWNNANNEKANVKINNFIPRDLRKEKNLISLIGLCSITYTWTVITGDMFKNKNVGIYEIEDHLSNIEVRKNSDIKIVKKFLDK